MLCVSWHTSYYLMHQLLVEGLLNWRRSNCSMISHPMITIPFALSRGRFYTLPGQSSSLGPCAAVLRCTRFLYRVVKSLMSSAWLDTHLMAQKMSNLCLVVPRSVYIHPISLPVECGQYCQSWSYYLARTRNHYFPKWSQRQRKRKWSSGGKFYCPHQGSLGVNLAFSSAQNHLGR
jgi:hypothetical protein